MRKPEKLQEEVDMIRMKVSAKLEDGTGSVTYDDYMRMVELEVQFAQLVAMDSIARTLEEIIKQR
jgi:hypothetical protein